MKREIPNINKDFRQWQKNAYRLTMEAIQNGSLKFEGDGAIALWFAGIAKGAN